MAEANKLWGGRFGSEPSQVLQELNSSIQIDKVMWAQDITGSVMYSKALVKAGMLTEEEQNVIEEGLLRVKEEWVTGSFIIGSSDEDIHTANERRLRELIGPLGGKLHTGRSRNDQVALDLRLWLKDHLVALSGHLKQLISVIKERAREEMGILFPGYTHLQRAQPVRWSHWLLSYAWSLFHDLEKMEGVYQSTDICPLGSGALAGCPLPVDREDLAKSLGFSKASENSLQTVADRDFVAEYLFWCSLTSCHLSRLAEDLIMYSSSEFGFVKLDDAFSTGSSLMPQKKNADGLELIRGKSARMIANVMGFMTVLKGLPSTYNKDLQEDKELLFNSAETLEAVIKVATGTLQTMKVNIEACRSALTEDMLATDLAYFLVMKGVPFRDAHGIAGRVVAEAEAKGCTLSQVPLSSLRQISPHFTGEVSQLWNFENSVEQYSCTGGTAASSVKQQIDRLETKLKNFSFKLSA